MTAWARIRQIFEKVVELQEPERSNRVDELCGDDAELRRDVERLLARDGSTVGLAIDSGPAICTVPDPRRLRQIGSYTLARVIGSGGMGTVFEARQESPARTVALKVLRTLIASPAARQRLAYEAETLGRLNHPHIAQIHESGTWSDPDTGEEMPFFAMEFVENAQQITDYAATANLDLQQRLELFLSVCDAVQHGHLQGVLHRDLKPANILVGSDGSPKVIDFGIARATDMVDDPRTLRTLTGQVLGTPGYMSPEQIDGDPSQIDVRADVYGLGSTLYELLVGTPPHDKGTTSLGQFLRKIRESAPPRPSTVERSLVPLAADLDWLLLRALASDPDERYPSVAELAADLRRFLRNEPLQARPPTRGYLLRKFVRRHRLPVLAGTAVVLAMAIGTVATSLGWHRAVKAEALADSRRQQAENLAGELWYLTELQTEILKSTDGDRNVMLVDVIDRASRRLHDAPPASDQVAGGLHDALGVAFLDLGMTDRAQEHFDRAKERTGPGSTANRQLALAVTGDQALLLAELGKLEAAETARREVLRGKTELFGADHWRTAHERANLAAVLHERGGDEEAVELYRRALPVLRSHFGEGHERLLFPITGLATALHALGQTEEAQSLYTAACALAERQHGSEHPRTLSTRNTFAVFLLEAKKIDEAIPLLRELWDSHTRVSGPAHSSTLRVASNLAICFERQQRYPQAEAIYRQVLQLREHSGAATEMVDLITRFNLCVALHLQEHAAKVAEAVEQLDSLLIEARRILPATNWRLAVFRQHRGVALRKAGRFSEAEADFAAARTVLAERLGANNSRTRSNWEETALLYEAWGKPDEALRWRKMLTDR